MIISNLSNMAATIDIKENIYLKVKLLELRNYHVYLCCSLKSLCVCVCVFVEIAYIF